MTETTTPNPRPSREALSMITWRSCQFVAVTLAIALLLAASWVIMNTKTFGSPDEAGNDFFVRHLAQTGSYTLMSPLTAEQLAVFHPRTAGVRGNTLVPASFLGLVQIGALINRIAGERAYLLLTPLLALAALFALYGLFRSYCGPWWSLLGTTLVALHPVWWQFQTLPAFHNGAFTSLMVVTALLLKRHHYQPSWRRALFVGLAYGLALVFRPVELFWTGPLIAIVLVTQSQGWRWLLLVMSTAGLWQLPWLIVSSQIYHTPLATAYTPSGIITANGASGVGRGLWKYFIPPGGWSWHWLSSVWWFLLLLVPAWSAMTLASLSTYFRRKVGDPLKLVKLGLITLFVVSLVVYYGSWNLYPLEPASRIGSLASYARYWLPLYVAMGYGVIFFLRRLWARSSMATILVIIGLFTSQIAAIVWHPVSGIIARFDRDRTAQAKRHIVLSATAANALIFAGQSDKYFLDDRPVAFRLPATDSEWELLRQVRSERPVWLYVTPRQFRRSSLEKSLQSVGLRLGKTISVQDDQLWEITL